MLPEGIDKLPSPVILTSGPINTTEVKDAAAEQTVDNISEKVLMELRGPMVLFHIFDYRGQC